MPNYLTIGNIFLAPENSQSIRNKSQSILSSPPIVRICPLTWICPKGNGQERKGKEKKALDGQIRVSPTDSWLRLGPAFQVGYLQTTALPTDQQ